MSYRERLTRVAIIGRPNVGKSTLFNIITESRRAVVKDQPGVTRDILIERAQLWDQSFEIIDTGGLTENADPISYLIRKQVVQFLQTVDILLVVLDFRAGLLPEDNDVLRLAHESGLPYIIILNKVDRASESQTATYEFLELGVDLLTASFEKREGLSDIFEALSVQLRKVEEKKKSLSSYQDIALEQEQQEEQEQEQAQAQAQAQAQGQEVRQVTLAIVGKPNVGKSSLLNRLLGEERVLVSPIAGTTVDPVDVEIEVEGGRRYTLIDTAGLRRQSRTYGEELEVLARFKTRDAMSRADIVLLVIDAQEGPTQQDAKMLEEAIKENKAVLLIANKSDLAQPKIPQLRGWFRERVQQELYFFDGLPIVFTSATTGRGLREIFTALREIERQMSFRISTSELNDFFTKVIRQAPAPVWGNQNVKFYYLTQTRQKPPAFIAYANRPEGVTPVYRRFLCKKIQNQWGLEGVPVRIFVMPSSRR